MATYNGEKYVEEMLRSLEKQTEDDFFCYIHDDGSTDQTMHILKKWVEDHPYHFMILFWAVSRTLKQYLSLAVILFWMRTVILSVC